MVRTRVPRGRWGRMRGPSVPALPNRALRDRLRLKSQEAGSGRVTSRLMSCDFCGEPLVDPIEEAFNIAFIAHVKANARCMELFSYGMSNLRNEVGVRLGQKPVVEGL